MNAATALYLRKKARVSGDVTADYFFHVLLQYLNDPNLPVERQFKLVHGWLPSTDDPSVSDVYEPALVERAGMERIGKTHLGNTYWGTGAYVLEVRFGRDSTKTVIYWKNFHIDQVVSRATPACRNPASQLRENLQEGKKVSFCCGKLMVMGLSVCCCGGWTHESVSILGTASSRSKLTVAPSVWSLAHSRQAPAECPVSKGARARVSITILCSDNYCPMSVAVGSRCTHKRSVSLQDRKSTRLNSSHSGESRMPSSA